ncbi:PIN domain-containing protein [Acinetobacter pittii]|uniref:PIN domain-containing protein n=1 Tax=Acinetobacter pittii TaxID=48296 RepID=UPI003B42B776
MIHVALDTSGIGKNRNQKNASYKALKRLVEANQLTIHIPYVVKRELETQELAYYLNEYRAVKDNLRKFLKVPKSKEIHEITLSINEQIENAEQKILEDAQIFSRSWLDGLHSQIQELDVSQTIQALEAYFNGLAPLTTIKNREDIPDSFICRGIERIKSNLESLTLIANDKKIIKSFENSINYKIFKNIDDFIASPKIQEKLKGLDIIEKETVDLTNFINKFEKINPIIHNYLESNISEELWQVTINLDSIDNGDDEATITSAYDGENIKVNFDEPIHYGNNQLGYYFELQVEAEIEYFMNIHDTYSHLDDDILMNMTYWNDYISKVSRTAQLHVSGVISIQIIINQIDSAIFSDLKHSDLDEELNNIYEESKINIESIDEIHIV